MSARWLPNPDRARSHLPHNFWSSYEHLSHVIFLDSNLLGFSPIQEIHYGPQTHHVWILFALCWDRRLQICSKDGCYMHEENSLCTAWVAFATYTCSCFGAWSAMKWYAWKSWRPPNYLLERSLPAECPESNFYTLITSNSNDRYNAERVNCKNRDTDHGFVARDQWSCM